MNEATGDPAGDPAEAAVDAFLALVAERGYGAVSLRDVAAACGLGLAEFHRRFPDKPALVAGYLARVDGEVLAGSVSADDPDETARDRLFDVMMRRYDALRPRRAAMAEIHRAARRDPLVGLALLPALRRSMALMLEAAGVPSDGLAGALRQGGLLVLHEAVVRVFESDDSADLSKTMAALDGRLKSAERWAQSLDRMGRMRRTRSRSPERGNDLETPAS